MSQLDTFCLQRLNSDFPIKKVQTANEVQNFRALRIENAKSFARYKRLTCKLAMIQFIKYSHPIK